MKHVPSVGPYCASVLSKLPVAFIIAVNITNLITSPTSPINQVAKLRINEFLTNLQENHLHVHAYACMYPLNFSPIISYSEKSKTSSSCFHIHIKLSLCSEKSKFNNANSWHLLLVQVQVQVRIQVLLVALVRVHLLAGITRFF